MCVCVWGCRLSDVSLDIATPQGTGAVARNVEQCLCPANYQGTSCEQCVDGYYRSRTGPYLGVCVPCQCNNKADRCDPESGECVVSDREGGGGGVCGIVLLCAALTHLLNVLCQ